MHYKEPVITFFGIGHLKTLYRKEEEIKLRVTVSPRVGNVMEKERDRKKSIIFHKH